MKMIDKVFGGFAGTKPRWELIIDCYDFLYLNQMISYQCRAEIKKKLEKRLKKENLKLVELLGGELGILDDSFK